MRRNPDESYRRLERAYSREPTLYNGALLLREYLRTGATGFEELLDHLDDLYPGPYIDLGIEQILIAAHFALGHESRDLCDGGRIVCRYSKPLIWDMMVGYPPGTSQRWIDETNIALLQKGLVTNLPVWYDDSREPSKGRHHVSNDSFHRQRTPHYAVALFHNTRAWGDKFDGFLRVIWNNVVIESIKADSSSWKTKGVFELMMEDEPMLRDYSGPRYCIGSVPSRASGGRNSFSSTHTKRVGLDRGIPEAIDICMELAECIYFAEDLDAEFKCSGTDLYTD